MLSTTLSDCTTVKWKKNDLKALGGIAGDVTLAFQVYIRHAVGAEPAWKALLEQCNRNTLKNKILITKEMHNFKMQDGTRFQDHIDKFSELVSKLESVGEDMDDTRHIVLVLGSLTNEYQVIASVLENTPNIGLMQVVESLSSVEKVPEDASSRSEKAFMSSKKSVGKGCFNGKCNYCGIVGHKEA